MPYFTSLIFYFPEVNIKFQQSTYAVSEDNGMVTVCVNIDGVSADGLAQNLSVSLSHIDIQSAG